jgi:hypothetical protein
MRLTESGARKGVRLFSTDPARAERVINRRNHVTRKGKSEMPISLKNSTSILNWVRYSPQANILTVQSEDKPREMSFVGKSFLIDIENGARGWLLITEGMRDWKPFPIGEDPPPSPGPGYKLGFSVLLYAPKQFANPEAHEMCSNTGAHLSFCERLFNECEPKFGEGNSPIVKITEAEAIKIGKGKSREFHFEIVKWVPRPQAIIDALAKLKAAGATTKDTPARGGAANDETDDFGDGVTSPNDKPKAGGGGTANDADDFDTEGENSPQDKPKAAKANKGRGKKAAPEPEHSSDILDDPIPFG